MWSKMIYINQRRSNYVVNNHHFSQTAVHDRIYDVPEVFVDVNPSKNVQGHYGKGTASFESAIRLAI